MTTLEPGRPAFPHARLLLTAPANHLVHRSQLDGLLKAFAMNPLTLLAGTFGYVANGGTLSITDAGLDFAPHSVNLAVDHEVVALDQIARIRRRRVLLRVGFDVELHDGRVVPFVCWKNDEVFAACAELGIPTG